MFTKAHKDFLEAAYGMKFSGYAHTSNTGFAIEAAANTVHGGVGVVGRDSLSGLSEEQIAEKRGYTVGTVQNYLRKFHRVMRHPSRMRPIYNTLIFS